MHRLASASKNLLVRVLVTAAVFTSSLFALPAEIAQAAGSRMFGDNGYQPSRVNLGNEVEDLQDAQAHSATSGFGAQLSNGDYVFAWYNDTTQQIHAQRVNAAGDRLWGADGALVSSDPGTSMMINNVVADASGGAIFVYTRGGSVEIYAQKLNSSGLRQWGNTGTAVANEGGVTEQEPSSIADGSGGVITVYTRGTGASADIRVQRLNASGTKQWGTNGTVVSAATAAQNGPLLVSDGSGGIIAGWNDQRSGGNDIYAQRMNSSGVAQWTANGVAVTAATGNQLYMTSATADGSGGANFVWQDERGTPNNGVYAQKMNSSGVAQWTANGVALFTTTATSVFYNPKVTMSATNAMVVFSRADADGDLYVQKLNASGVKMFGDGLEIANATGLERAGSIVTAGDGSTDVLVTWSIAFPGDTGVIKGQRVNTNGDVEWTAGGVTLANDLGTVALDFTTKATHPYAFSNSNGDLVLAAPTEGVGIQDLTTQRAAASDGAPQWRGVGALHMPNGPSGLGSQHAPAIATDGTYTYLVWYDKALTESGDLYAQKYDSAGVEQWTDGGVAIDVSSDGVYAQDHWILADGAGGAIVVWHNTTDGEYRATRLTSSGGISSGWSSAGTVFTASSIFTDQNLVVTTDGSSGFIAAWADDNGLISYNRMNSGGSVLWGATGTAIVNSPLDRPHIDIMSDGASGAYIAFNFNDGSTDGAHIVRINSSGAVATGWGYDGRTFTTEGSADYPKLASDGSGGAVVAWYEDTGVDYDVLAQRYNATGTAQWTAGGVTVAGGANDQTDADLVAVSGGATIIGYASYNGSNSDLRAQKLDSSGAQQWGAAGKAIAATNGDNVSTFGVEAFAIVGDGSTGAMFAWEDFRTGSDIYAGHIDVNGDVRWGADGMTAGAKAGRMDTFVRAVYDGSDGLLMVFLQEGSPLQVTLQHIEDSDSPAALAAPTGMSDTMTRLKASTASDHVIRHTLPSGKNFDSTSSTDVLAYDFASAFTLGGTWVTGDFTFNDGTARGVNAVAQGAGTTTVSCSDGANNVGIAIDTTAKTFRVRPCGSSYASSTNTTTVTFTIDGTATDGTLTNPATPGAYLETITMDDEGNAPDTIGQLQVYVMDDDQVTVTADVNATMTFDIDIQATCGSESAAPYTVALGTLSPSAVTTAPSRICLDLDTNAAAGAYVTVQGSGAADALESAGSGDSIGTAYGASPVALAAGTDGYGLCVESTSVVTGSATASAPYNGACSSQLVGGVDSAAPQQILTTANAPVDGATNQTASIQVKAAVSTTTAAANDYTDVLTFIATGTY
jgi:hypothetical protein